MNQIDLDGLWRVGRANKTQRLAPSDPLFEDDDWGELSLAAALSRRGAEPHEPMVARRSFAWPESGDGRFFLACDRSIGTADVWFDGRYCGETDPSFPSQVFEVSNALKQSAQHLVAIEFPAPAPGASTSADAPAHGLAPVTIFRTGTVRVARLKALCTEASPEVAVFTVYAELDAERPCRVDVRTSLAPESVPGTSPHEQALHDPPVPTTEHVFTRSVSAGANRLRWNVVIEQPDLWWPFQLGEQPLFAFRVEVTDDSSRSRPSDARTLHTGIRHIAYNNGLLSVNGERLFIKALDTKVFDKPDDPYARSFNAVKGSGVNVIYEANEIRRPEFYEAADQAGVLVLQSVPAALESRDANIRSSRIARQSVEALGHHPSVALWVRQSSADERWWSRLASVRRVIRDADPSRPLITAPEEWAFGANTDSGFAAFVAKCSRRTRLVAFRASPGSEHVYIDRLRQLKYRPLGGFIASSTTPEDLLESCAPVRFVFAAESADASNAAITVHLVSDLPRAITGGLIRAVAIQGDEKSEWSWEGEAVADSVTLIGTMPVTTVAWKEVSIEVTLDSEEFSTHQTVDLVLE